MATTDKQQRNGLPGLPEVANPQPGPMPDVAALMSEAQNVAVARTGPDMFSEPSGRDVSYEWDAGLAVGEMSGEA